MTAGGAKGARGMRRHRYAFVLLGSLQTTLIFTLAAIAVPLPRIGEEFGLERADLILLSASYGLTFAGLLLFGGRLADRYGGRPALAAGLVVLGAASAAAPFAPGVEALLAARFAQGAGAALVAPAAMAVLRAAAASPAAYSRSMATWGGLSVLGATAGNLLSGVISALLSWRWTFAVPLVVSAAALVLMSRLLPRTEPDRSRRSTFRGLCSPPRVSPAPVTGSSRPTPGPGRRPVCSYPCSAGPHCSPRSCTPSGAPPTRCCRPASCSSSGGHSPSRPSRSAPVGPR